MENLHTFDLGMQERRIYGVAVPLKHLTDAVMLLEASIPLKDSGKAIFRRRVIGGKGAVDLLWRCHELVTNRP